MVEKRRIQTKIDENVIFKMSRPFLKSHVFLDIDGGPLNSCCNDTKHLSHAVTRMSHLRLFSSWTRCDSSMDVQGDYDPCDASGFIRINAVRLASPQPVQNSLSIKLFQSLSYFLLFSTGWENTTACRVCPTQRIKEDDTNLLPYHLSTLLASAYCIYRSTAFWTGLANV